VRSTYKHLDREMWEYRERWDRDEVSQEAKDMALDAYVKAGLGLALIPAFGTCMNTF
jgi:hypothetical protein